VRPEIKFCGMTRGEDIAFAASLGAQYIGVILAGGPRHQNLDRAQALYAATPPLVRRVAVVADQTPIEIAGLVNMGRLQVVQLHADPSVERIESVRGATSAEVWAVIRVSGSELPANLIDVARAANGIVLDARVPGGLGGSGVTLPWSDIARRIHPARKHGRLILAGGLRPDNLPEAIGTLDPDVVDVSSGVETAPGIKDHQKMRAFRDAAFGIGVEQ
jgi:phosphoribosylanthranilate isomerase